MRRKQDVCKTELGTRFFWIPGARLGIGYAFAAGLDVPFITDVADLTIPAMSDRSVGIIIVLPSFASFPNSPMYCSAIRRLTASDPPSSIIAWAIFWIPPAVAVATASISNARPSASLMRFCFSPRIVR